METSLQTSGSYLVVMKLCLAVLVCLNGMGYQSTDAAVAGTMTMFTCVKTRITDSTYNVTSGVCDCPYNYVPIPTGCAAPLSQPWINNEYGRTTELFPGKAVKLTCSTEDEEAVTFEWRKDGKTVEGVTTQVFDITSWGTDKTASFTCVIKDGTESQKSNSVQITVVAATGPASPPELSIPPSSGAVQGATIDVQCRNIPIGATYKFQFNNDNLTDTVKQDIANNNKSLFCVLDVGGTGFTTNITSKPVVWSMPIVDNIMLVTTSISGSVTYKTGTPVNVTCITYPTERYMLDGTKKINYIFQDSGKPATSVIGNTYMVPSTVGQHNITCSASYDNKPALTSAQVTVTFSDDYLKAPVLSTSLTTVKPGLGVYLTCGDYKAATSGNNLCRWIKDGAVIPRQTDCVIQYGNFQKTDAGKFTCRLFGDERYASNEVTVKAASHGHRIMGSAVLLGLVAMASSQII